jgi:hypothetical protein
MLRPIFLPQLPHRLFFQPIFFREGVGVFVRLLCACLSATFQRLNHFTDDRIWFEHHASTVCQFTVISYPSRDNMVDARD